MKQITVGVGEYFVTRNPEMCLVTYALGTCLGVTLYDPLARVGGMLHFMLPTSAVNQERAKRQPAVFCDTGLPLLLLTASQLGAARHRLVLKVAGGASILNQGESFDIGKKNYRVLLQLLAQNHLTLAAEAVGGTRSRTLKMDIATGTIILRTPGCPDQML